MADFNLGQVASTVFDSGLTGIFTESLQTASFDAISNTSYRFTTTYDGVSTYSTSITSITNTLIGSDWAGWQVYTSGDGIGDDSSKQFVLPFSVEYFDTTYNNIYIGSNFYVTFGTGATTNSVLATSPSLPKIMISAGNRSVQRIYYNQQTSSPGNGVVYIRVEGNTAFNGTGTSMVYEIVFYESPANQIDLHIGTNTAAFTVSSTPLVSPVDYDTDTKTYKPTSNSNMSPDFTDTIQRVYTTQVSQDIPIAGLTFSPINSIPTKRPAGGQLYPRGVYNK